MPSRRMLENMLYLNLADPSVPGGGNREYVDNIIQSGHRYVPHARAGFVKIASQYSIVMTDSLFEKCQKTGASGSGEAAD